MSEQKLMKDYLDRDAVVAISQTLSKVVADFPSELFINDAVVELEGLELKQRVDYLILILAKYLPDNFVEAAEILLVLKQHWPTIETDEVGYNSFTAWPLIDYVAAYGLEHPQVSLNVLKNMTSLFSAEFAIRAFIEQHFELTYQQLLLWCDDKDEHIRRLASEGIRPRLPWGKRLSQFCDDPDAIFPILERLKDDSSLYVRKSVANNLNDISKDHPEKVISLCQKWLVDASEQRQWIIRHALRTLIKSGHKEVFPLLGYSTPKVEITGFELSAKTISLGQQLVITSSLQSLSETTQKLVLDYKVHHVKKNGQLTSKVFKWKNINLQPKEQLSLQKSHAFKQITTRQYYTGTHYIELLINGQNLAKAEFELVF